MSGRTHDTHDLAPRTERVARFLHEQGVDELRLTALHAVDHAYKSAAEVAEMRAVYEGALGKIGLLEDENERLRDEVDRLKQQYGRVVASGAWRTGSRLKWRLIGAWRRVST